MKVLLVIIIVWLFVITCLFVGAFNIIDEEIDKAYNILLGKGMEINRMERELEWILEETERRRREELKW